MKLISPFTVLLGSWATIYGWVLHDSCSTTYKDLVINGMEGAFDLAQAGADALSITESGSGTTWQARKDLISYMFAGALTGGKIDAGNAKWQTVKKTFASVLAFDTNKGQPLANPPSRLRENEVIVYCDFKHFTEGQDCDGKKDKNSICDTYTGIAFLTSDIFHDCKGSNFLTSGDVEAMTMEYASEGLNRASFIQICPWYLKEQQNLKIQRLKDQGKKPSLARSFGKISSLIGNSLKTPMDVAYTFDATMLHEISHAVPYEGTVDGAGGGKSGSYGWKNCAKMSSNGVVNNADTYAFFGLASRMISPNNGATAQRPMNDGSIQVLPAGGAKKRYLHDRADHSNGTLTADAIQLPTTSSIFKTSIRGLSPGSKSSLIDGNSTGPWSGTYKALSSGGPSTSKSLSKSLSKGPSKGLSKDLSEVRSTSKDSSTPKSLSKGLSKGPSESPSKDSTSSPNPIGSSNSTAKAASSSRRSLHSSSPGLSSNLSPRGSITSKAATKTTSPVSNTAVITTTKGSSVAVIPITVINVSKDGTTTPVTYISTHTSSGDIKPTGAWMCTGPLCQIGSVCLVPLFCAGLGGSSGSWGLCCGWSPPSIGGGPPAGGPKPGPSHSDKPGDGDGDSNSDHEKDRTSDSKPSESKPSKSSPTSSCSTQTKSACDTSLSVFTPAGATTESTSTITLSCSTITGCSASVTASVTTGAPQIMGTPIGDSLNAFDTAVTNWYEVQQSALALAMADDSTPYITWSPDEVPGSSANSSKTHSSITSHPTSANTACVVTSATMVLPGIVPTVDTFCLCGGETQVEIATSTNAGGTAYVKCENRTTLSTITPKTTPPKTALPKPTTPPKPVAPPSPLTCNGKGGSDWNGTPREPFDRTIAIFSLNHVCDATNRPNYYLDPSEDDPACGERFWFTANDQFYMSTAYKSFVGWWPKEVHRDQSDVRDLWLHVSFSKDQTGCKPKKKFDMPSGAECQSIFYTILDNCDTDTETKKNGGSYHINGPNGCVDYYLWGVSTNGGLGE